MRTLHGDSLRGDSISARAHAPVGIFSRKVYPCLYGRAARGRKPLASSQQLIETFPRPRTTAGPPEPGPFRQTANPSRTLPVYRRTTSPFHFASRARISPVRSSPLSTLSVSL